MMLGGTESQVSSAQDAAGSGVLRRWEIWLLVSVLLYSLIPVVGGILRAVELLGGPGVVPVNPRALVSPLPIVAHTLSSALFCVGGALQFLPSVRRRWPLWHRSLGYGVLVSGLISAATGLWMTYFFAFAVALQGELLYVTRLILAPAMMVLLVWAGYAAAHRMFERHAAAMIRAYAIGQGASTQTVLGIAWAVVMGTELEGLTRDYVMVTAWVLNAVCAELIIARFLPRRDGRQTNRYPLSTDAGASRGGI